MEQTQAYYQSSGAPQDAAELLPTHGEGSRREPAGSGRRGHALLFVGAAAMAIVAGAVLSVHSSTSGNWGASAGPKATTMALSSAPEATAKTEQDFDDEGRFVLKNYDRSKPFASFLPALGGEYGIPMWAFYINRGQGIAAFGLENKEHPLMEFEPANIAYAVSAMWGFRTFLKGKRFFNGWAYQPFYPLEASTWGGKIDESPARNMHIGMNEFEIVDYNKELGIQTNVLYFTVPNEDFPGLVRRMTITNTDSWQALDLEILDGLAQIFPYGIFDWYIKNMARTTEAWMQVYNMEESDKTQPFFHLSSSIKDSDVVTPVVEGNWAVAMLESDGAEEGGEHELLPFIVDPVVVFDQDTTMTTPVNFLKESLSDLLEGNQVLNSRVPCSFAAKTVTLKPGASITITSVYGHAVDLETFTDTMVPIASKVGFVKSKRAEAVALTERLTAPVATDTGSSIFNGYVKQNFMDNVLRGGFPLVLGSEEDPKIYPTFSRIHGDLERDYNYYVFAPEYFSQGPGNFRDVTQNRRSDVLVQPIVGNVYINMFLSFVQADGYNPLTVQTPIFNFPSDEVAEEVAAKSTDPEYVDELTTILTASPFRPGSLFTRIAASNVTLTIPREDFVTLVTSEADYKLMANFTQDGFWADHWTYTLDLIVSYLMVFPDKEEWMLWEADPVPTFFSPAKVLPRDQKYVLTDKAKGTVRQFSPVKTDGDKKAILDNNMNDPDGIWMCVKGTEVPSEVPPPKVLGTGHCQVLYMKPVAKLFLLATVKFCSLDEWGMGVEIEAGKPGWLDALNGLPALLGSGMPETDELLRILRYLKGVTHYGHGVTVPSELDGLIERMLAALSEWDSDKDDFKYWDTVATAREQYRVDTNLWFSGAMVNYTNTQWDEMLGKMVARVEFGINRAVEFNGGFPPSYFKWEVTEYSETNESDTQGRPFVVAEALEPKPLPYFLEGPVRHMKTLNSTEAKRELHYKVKASDLYDPVLGMFKISGSLRDETIEIGRVTGFSPGWLENESIWTHMAYKYLLELIRGKLYDEFYLEINTGITAFLDPDTYGRNPLECSSFIASSAFTDPKLWGAGFVSRLSGSTAEFISMWALMMFGPQPFYLEDDGSLSLALAPALPSWLFKADNTLSFTFLGSVNVTYHNPSGMDTWTNGITIEKAELISADGESTTVEGSTIPAPYAEAVRSLEYPSIDVYLSEGESSSTSSS